MNQQSGKSTPAHVKNLRLAFLIVSLVMVSGQIINLIITFLPAAAQTPIQVDGETTVTVASLRNAYISSVIIVGLIYGVVWFGLRKTQSWARWVSVILSVLAAVGGIQAVARVLTSGTFDMVGLALGLAQLIAAGWVLALVFRVDVDSWFKHKGNDQQTT